MGFKKETIKDAFLVTTEVDNLFISEYMPQADGTHVKVYLYGLFCAEAGLDLTDKELAKQLGVDPIEVEKAWDYWEEQGVVERTASGDVQFKQLRDMLYCDKKNKKKEHVESVEDENIADLILNAENLMGRPLSPMEADDICSWHLEIGMSKALILGAIDYCAERDKLSINYMFKVAKQWFEDGVSTEEDVEDYLQGLQERQGRYKKILQALGLNRNATDAEKNMIDSWYNDMKFNQERIDSALIKASFISNPNLRYVNKILENWAEEAGKIGRDVNESIPMNMEKLNLYFEHLREEAYSKAREAKEKVYKEIPKIKEIDEDLSNLRKEVPRAILAFDNNQAENLKGRILKLEADRENLLEANGFSKDYTDAKYVCDICKDTGIMESGERCKCIGKRMGEAEIWQNSISGK